MEQLAASSCGRYVAIANNTGPRPISVMRTKAHPEGPAELARVGHIDTALRILGVLTS